MRKFLLVALFLAVLPWSAVAFCGDAQPKVKIEIVAPNDKKTPDHYATNAGVVKFRAIADAEKSGDRDKAIEGYRQFITEFKDQPVPHYYIARLLLARADKAGALAEIASADKKNPG
jgi:hypothetical protein